MTDDPPTTVLQSALRGSSPANGRAAAEQKFGCGLSQPRAPSCEMQPRLCLHRHRRWPGDLHHHAGGRDRGRLALVVEVKYQPPLLAACGAGCLDPCDHAAAAARDEVAADRAAIPPQGGTRTADRPGEIDAIAPRRPRIAGFALVHAGIDRGLCRARPPSQQYGVAPPSTRWSRRSPSGLRPRPSRCRRLHNGAR